jgi:hypothetical protein
VAIGIVVQVLGYLLKTLAFQEALAVEALSRGIREICLWRVRWADSQGPTQIRRMDRAGSGSVFRRPGRLPGRNIHLPRLRDHAL